MRAGARLGAAAALPLLLLLGVARGQGVWGGAAGTAVQLEESTGNILLYNKNLKEGDPNKVSLLFATLQEVDIEGRPVGRPYALAKHQVKGIAKASQDLPEGGGRAKRHSFIMLSGPPGNASGVLEVDAFVITRPAKVGLTAGGWAAAPGDVKLNITLTRWSWGRNAIPGDERQGAFVDIVLAVKGKSGKPRSLTKGATYDLGGGVRIEVGRTVLVDGKEVAVAPSFPRLRHHAGDRALVLRLPRFANFSSCSPLVRMGAGAMEAGRKLAAASGTDRAGVVSAGGVSVRAHSRGGRLATFAAEDGKSDRNKVVLSLESLKEVDARGNPLGNNKHSMPTFVGQDFAVTIETQKNLGTARGNKISMAAPVGNIGEIRVDAFVLSKGGMVGPDGDMLYAAVGDVKFHIELSSWNWCGCKQNGNLLKGAYIDLEVSIQGAYKKPILTDAEKNSWALGGGVAMELTHMIEVDGVDIDMPEGFPYFEMRGGTPYFMVRVPKFAKSAVYEGLFRMSASETLGGGHNAMYVSHALRRAPALFLQVLAPLVGAMLAATAGSA